MMRVRSKRLLAGLSVLFPVLLGACSSGGAGTQGAVPSGTAGQGTPVTGGTLTMLDESGPRSLDPLKMAGGISDEQWGALVYDQLIYLNSHTNAVVPALALSVTPDKTNTVWTITLRPKVKFTDGSAFDATAVMDEFTRVKNPANSSPAYPYAAQVASMKVMNATTLQVTLASPNSGWYQALGTGGGLSQIPSPAAVAKYGADYGTSPQTTVGAGPFTIAEWDPTANGTFPRNPNYWDAPEPYLDKVIINESSVAQTSYSTFTAGEADVMNIYVASPVIPELDSQYPNRFQSTSTIAAIAMNTRSGPTADIRMRQVLTDAVDMQQVAAAAAPGVTTTNSWSPSGSEFSGIGVTFPPSNLAEAKSIMAQYLKSTGQRSVTITYNVPTDSLGVAEALQQEWSQVPGLNVKLNAVGNVQFETEIVTRAYQGMLNDGVSFTPLSLAPALLPTSTQDVSFMSDPQVNTAMKAALSTSDASAQMSQMKIVAQRLNADLPYIPEYVAPFNWWANNSVKGFVVLSGATIPFQSVWLTNH